jgi:hypothetical protein
VKVSKFDLRWSFRACLPIVLMGIACGSAYANITPVLNSNNACSAGTGAGSCFSQDGGSYNGAGFAWIYTIDLDANETIHPTSNTLGAGGSSYGVIYDFGTVLGTIALTGTLANSTNFVISTALTTTSPAGVNPTDNTGLLNVVYQAKVGTDINGATLGGGGSIGTLTIISPFSGSPLHSVNFVGQATSNSSGLTTANIGSIQAPNQALTPEPSTTSSLLIGLGLIGGFVFNRKRVSRN